MISNESTDKPEVLTVEEIDEMYAPPKSAILNDATPEIPSEKEGMNAIGLILSYREILFALRKDGGWRDVSDKFRSMAAFRKKNNVLFIKHANNAGDTGVEMITGVEVIEELSGEKVKYGKTLVLRANTTNTNTGIAQIRAQLESLLQLT